MKNTQQIDRCYEECDTRRSERKAARRTTYVLKRNRYLMHGQSNTNKRKKIPAYIRPVGRETREQRKRRKIFMQKRTTESLSHYYCRFRAPPLELKEKNKA